MSAIREFEAAVREKMAAEGITKEAATRAVIIEDKELHQRYLAEYNEQYRANCRR